MKEQARAIRRPAVSPVAWACVLAVAGLCAPAAAQNLPQLPSVVRGQATFATQGPQLTVSNTANTIVNWQSFSVGAGHSVRFEQPHASSQVLNRVLGRDPSQIFGQISSNGGVWLLNPHGVVFGPGARVDVASLVVSTLNIGDDDWLAKRWRLTAPVDGGADVSLVNRGELRTTAGGRLLLVGGEGGVHNEGLAEAPGGQLVLAAGRSVDLADTASPQVAVRVAAPAGEVLNLGRLAAPGGRIDLLAAMVNQHGIVRAGSLAGGAGGEVVLRASVKAELGAGSDTAADGTAGGRVLVEAPTVLASGRVAASGHDGTGGRVQFTGAQIGLLDGSRVEATGSDGGGQVMVGGGVMGQDPTLPNAKAVYLAPGASIAADAGVRGAGGTIVLWSDLATRAFGTLSARGGPQGGDGGFIETSGGWLDARPLAVYTSAPLGRAGQWLLDPNNITITNAGPDTNVSGGPNFTTTNDSAVLSAASIVSALSAGTSVTVSTGAAGSNNQSGDIVFSGATLLVAAPSPVTLTVNAARNIDLLGASIHASAAPVNVVFNAAGNGTGTVNISSSSIQSGGGNILVGGNAVACGAPGCAPFAGAVGFNAAGRRSGVDITISTLDAGTAGTVRVRGASGAGGGISRGIAIDSSSTLSGREIDLAGWVGTNGASDQYGVDVGGQLTATRRLAIEGTSAVAGPGGSEVSLEGVRIGFAGNVRVLPPAADPAALLSIIGHAGARPGHYDTAVSISGDLTASGQAGAEITGNGGVVSLVGSGSFDTSAAGRLAIGGSGQLESWRDLMLPTARPVSLSTETGVAFNDGSATGSPSSVLIDTAGKVAAGGAGYGVVLNFGSAPTTVRGSEFDLGATAGTSLSAGSVLVQSPVIKLGSGASISSGASGDAIVMAGLGGNAQMFQNLAGSGVLSTPNGRWLVYGTDPTDAANFALGGLTYDFSQFGIVHPSAPVGAGRGVLFSRAATIDVIGQATGPINKVYDGNTTAQVSGSQFSLTGLLPGHSFVGSGVGLGDFSYADKNVGVGIPIVASLSGPLPAVVDGQSKPVYGYVFTGSVANLRGDITARPVSLIGVSARDKVYDGTRVADFDVANIAGLVPGESLSVVPGSAQFDTKDVGTGKPVTGTLTLADGAGGGLARNYAVAGGGAITTTASITPRPVNVTGVVVDDKIYDGNRLAIVGGGTLTGAVDGESPRLQVLSGEFDTKDAGTGKPVAVQVALANGADGSLASNYTLVGGGAIAARGTIVPRFVTVNGITAADKVYDGTRTATLTGGSLGGLVAGETLTITSTGLFDTPDAGRDKPVTAEVTLGDGGGGGRASNYVVGNAGTFSTRASVTPRPVSVSGVTADTRAYDGTRAATLSGNGTLDGLVAGETLRLTLGSGQFDTKDAGTGKRVTASVSLADGSGRAANYSLAGGGVLALTGTITPKLLTLSSLSAADKVYDGTRTAQVSAGALVGLVPGETLQASVSGSFDTADAGAGKTVTAALGLAGGGTALASNYALDATTATTTASVLPRPVTVEGVFALDKVYDGTTAAVLSGSSFSGLVAGESLSLAAQAQFDNRNAGSGKRVSGTIALADGAGGRAANYSLANPGAFSGTAAILPRGLTVTSATAADKVYDGNTAASVSGWQLAGVIGSDQVAVTAGSGTFADANVGDGKVVSATASALGGSDAANYALAQPTVPTRAGIRPATLVYVANPVFGATGAALPPLSGTVSGFVAGDNLGNATSGALVFTTTATSTSPQGRYPVVGGGLGARNYIFSQSPGNATALSLAPMSTSSIGESSSTQPTVGSLLETLLPLPLASSAEHGRVLDVLPALTTTLVPGLPGTGGGPLAPGGFGATAGPSTSTGAAGGAPPAVGAAPTPGIAFRTLDFGALSTDQLAMTLAARDAYKKAVFAEAIALLEQNPELADLPACQTVEQAATGDCLITEALKPALRERLLREEAAPALAAAPAPPPAVAPAPAPTPAATPAAPAPAAAAAPAAPPAVAVAPPVLPRAPIEPEVQIRLPAPRPVVSASLPQIRRKLALVIGTDNYRDARIPKLDNAVGDANAVAAVLERSLGYQAVVIRDGTKSAIVRAFNQLAATVSPEDSVVVYYAGHGEVVEKTGLGYWQPTDADATRPQTWLSNSDIGKLLGQFGASQVALVSDSCFSGSLVSEERIRATGTLPDPAAVLSRRAAVVMSSGGNEPVFDAGKNGHSTFAWNLMRTLERVSAWRPGSNVFEQVRFAVAREIPQRPQYGASRAAGHQSGSDYLFEQRQLEAQPR